MCTPRLPTTFVVVLALGPLLAGCRRPDEPQGSVDAGPPIAMSLDVDASKTLVTPLEWGILHGLTRSELRGADPSALIRALKPRQWRLSDHNNEVYEWVVRDAQLPATLGTKVVWTVQDSFMMHLGAGSSTRLCVAGVTCPTTDAKHFSSFAQLRSAWQAFLPTLLATQPAADWYDIFSEPDLQVFGVSPDQLATLYLDAEQAIRARFPQAKLVAPSYGLYEEGTDERLLVFVRALQRAGGRPDAISWHEFGPRPLAVVDHAASTRAVACDAGPCPAFHVNEYENANYTMSPGRAVAWLAALQAADVQYANRACWDVEPVNGKPLGTCWTTFGGMLDGTYRATQPIYWVHERYAQMTAGARWVPATPWERLDVANRRLDGVAALVADMGPQARAVRLLVGNFGLGDASPVDVSVSGFPWLTDGTAVVAMERIASVGVRTVSAEAVTPATEPPVEVPVSGGRLRVTLPLVRASDAWGLVITPK